MSSRFDNWSSYELIISSLFFNCCLRKLILSCDCFIKRSELFIQMPLEWRFKYLLLNEFTSAKDDDFSVSNSSIIEFLDLINSSFSLIVKVSLLAEVSSILSLLLESWFDFGKERQVRVPRSFISTEWLSTNASSRSSKISFVTSLYKDSCTKWKTSFLPYFLLLRLQVCIEATVVICKSFPSTIWGTLLLWETMQIDPSIIILQYSRTVNNLSIMEILWNTILITVSKIVTRLGYTCFG